MRALKIAESFQNMGFEVHVITLDQSTLSAQLCDNSILESVPKGIHIHFASHSFKWLVPSLFKPNAHSISATDKAPWFKNKLKRLLVETLIFDSGFGWWCSVLRVANSLHKNIGADIVFATSPPFLPFLVPLFLKRRYDIPFIVDYRDLFFRNAHLKRRGPIKWLCLYLEHKVNQAANFVFSVSHGCIDGLSGINATKTRVIYNFFLARYYKSIPSAAPIKNTKTIRILFAGTCYSKNGIDVFCQSLSQLSDAQQSQIDLRYCGSSFSVFNSYVLKYQLNCVVTNLGYLNKDLLHQELLEAHILLSLIHETPTCSDPSVKGLMTTKIFEYLGYPGLIINICPDDHEIISLFSMSPIEGIAHFNGTQTEKLTKYLSELNVDTVKRYERNLSPYTWEKQWYDKITTLSTDFLESL